MPIKKLSFMFPSYNLLHCYIVDKNVLHILYVLSQKYKITFSNGKIQNSFLFFFFFNDVLFPIFHQILHPQPLNSVAMTRLTCCLLLNFITTVKCLTSLHERLEEAMAFCY